MLHFRPAARAVLLLRTPAASLAQTGTLWANVTFDWVKNHEVTIGAEPTLISWLAGLPMLSVVLFATPVNELIGAVLKMLA